MTEEIGTVVSTPLGPSPSQLDFVVTKGIAHRGQFVEVQYSEGTMICLITNVVKTNRYFERADSVKEFEATGAKIFEQFPTTEWEYLLAQTKPLGVFEGEKVKRASYPPSPGAKVRIASAENLKKFLGFDEQNGLLLGTVEYHDLPVKLNLSRLLKKHLCVLAMSGAGKCAEKETKILLENQEQKSIGAIVEEVLEKNKIVDGNCEFWKEDFGLKTYSLQDGKIKPAKITGYYRRKAPDFLIKVKTRSGKAIKLTPEHLVPVFNGKIEWVNAENLSENDWLFVPRIEWLGKESAIDFSPIAKCAKNVEIKDGFAKLKASKKLLKLVLPVDKDTAKLFAYLLAEGHNTVKKPRMSFTNCNKNIQDDFSRILFEKFGLAAKKDKAKEEVHFDSTLLAKCLDAFGFTNSSWTKFVPKEILQSNKKVLKAFLETFIDCDGYINPKKSEIEITLASKRLSEGIEEIIGKLGIISIRKTKIVNGKEYQKLTVTGSEELKKFGALELKVDYKKNALEKWQRKKGNPNIDIVPSLGNYFCELLTLLRMAQPQTESAGIINYLNRKDNPNRESLKKLIGCFEKRSVEVEGAIKEAFEIWESIPKTTESEALEIVETAYNCGLNFKTIALGSGISSTTARRVVRGITNPKHSIFSLAKNALKLQGKNAQSIETIGQLEANKKLAQIKRVCEAMNYSTQELCLRTGGYKQFLYNHSNNRGVPTQSKIVAIARELADLAIKSRENLVQANSIIGTLKWALNLNAFFDKVSKIEKTKPASQFVYDLNIESGNFIANNIVIHNSYFVSVMLEELLSRKKEQGRIAIVLLDVHGEYSSFAETLPASDKKHSDYSRHSKIVRARDIRIGVSKLSVGMLAGIIPGLSAPQKRDLGKIISKLQKEMRSGLGPYDLNAIKTELMQDSDIKENTKMALFSWLFDLEDLHLFDKTDEPSINDLVKPSQLTIIDLSDIINVRKKQIIVSYLGQKLFNERRQKRLPPFTMILEEAHQFSPEKASAETAISRSVIRTISREGRKFGASICIISQRPIQLDTTTLANCNTHIILRITNPYDLKHIGESSESLDSKSLEMITSLRVGEALIVGEAVNYPVFFKVRERKSLESRHEMSLEKAAMDFEEGKTKEEKETEEFL